MLGLIFDANEVETYEMLCNGIKITACYRGLLIIDSQKHNSQESQQVGTKIKKASQCTWSININCCKNSLTYRKRLHQDCIEHFLIKKIIEIFPDLRIDDIKRDEKFN